MQKIEDNFYQNKPKFSIKREDVIPLTELMNINERRGLYEMMNWPMEVQGVERVLENGNFEIRYPKGDKFFSSAVVIYELGHLRQDEFIDFNDNASKNVQKEKDAFSRGWERVIRYDPGFIDNLEIEFKEYKDALKIDDFLSFKDLYNFFRGVVNVNIALEKLDKNPSVEEEVTALKEAGIDDFFRKINTNKVGELIDEKSAKASRNYILELMII